MGRDAGAPPEFFGKTIMSANVKIENPKESRRARITKLESNAEAFARVDDRYRELESWELLIREFPRHSREPHWINGRARALSKLGRITDAHNEFLELTQRFPNYANGLIGLARIAAKQNNWPLCAKLWRDCVDRFPTKVTKRWYREWARALQTLDRLDEAASVYAVMIKLWPDDPSGWFGLAHNAGEQGDWAGSARLWRDCYTRFKDKADPRLWFGKLAESLHRSGDDKSALLIAERLRNVDPTNSIPWVVEARVAESRNNSRRAARAWTKAVDVARPKFKKNHFKALINSLISAGQSARAGELLVEFRQNCPDKAEWLPLEVNWHLSRGEWTEARHLIKFHAPGVEAAALFPREFVVRVLRSSGATVNEAFAEMDGWPNPEELEIEILSQFAPRKFAKTLWLHSPVLIQDWRTSARALLRQFLERRIYSRYEIFVTLAIKYCNERQGEKMRRVAVHRFPNSAVRAKLDQFLSRCSNAPIPWQESAYLWRTKLPVRSQSISSSLKILRRRLVVATVIRDESEILGRFFAHYAKLGVNTFIVIDNNSSDAPEKVIDQFPDFEIQLISAPWSFRQNGHGMSWINELLELGMAEWLLFADADELLVYPGCDAVRLPELVDHFDQRGETAMSAFMLDMFDDNFFRTGRPSDDFSSHNLFYAEHFQMNSLEPPFRDIAGGVRIENAGMLIKVPLVKASAGVRYTDNHHVTPCRCAVTSGVLRHYKIYRDRCLFGLDRTEITSFSRVSDRGGYCIERHVAMTQDVFGDLPMEHEVRLTHNNLLVTLGYMKADEQLRDRLKRAVPEDYAEPAHAVLLETVGKDSVGTEQHLWAQPRLKQLLDVIVKLAGNQERTKLLTVLRAQLPRFGNSTVRRAILVLAISALEPSQKTRTVRRALMRSIERIDSAAIDANVGALREILERLATIDSTATDAIWECFAKRQAKYEPLLPMRCPLAPFSGNSSPFALLSGGASRGTRMRGDNYLMQLVRKREWPKYYRYLESIFSDATLGVKPDIVKYVNMCADPAIARTFLQNILTRHPPVNVNKDSACAIYAVLRSLGRNDDIIADYGRTRHLFPKQHKIYFDRLVLRSDESKKLKPRIWCLGLSRTGTTSLHHYLSQSHLMSAHWVSSSSQNLIDIIDTQIYDAVSDTSAVYLARKFGIDEGSTVIATTRSFDSWECSFIQHFKRDLDTQTANFEDMKSIFYSGEQFSYGGRWFDIHHELYFRFATLREAYHEHQDWLKSLAEENRLLFVDLDDNEKGLKMSRFLGLEGQKAFPKLNSSGATL